MDTPARLRDDLDHGRIYWRTLTKRQRRAVIIHILAAMAVDDDFMTHRRYNHQKPAWAPLSTTLSESTGSTLADMAANVGLRYADARHICDCGANGNHVVPVVQLTAEGHESRQTLRLCDACYAEFLAMEALHA